MAVQTGFAAVAAAGHGFSLLVNLILGGTAALLLHSVVTEVRRSWAADRAAAAIRSAAQAQERSQEHTAFAASLGRQLRTARNELAQARGEVDRWSARSRELEARLTDAEAELARTRDALWISEAAEKRARAELVIAEQQPRHLRPA